MVFSLVNPGLWDFVCLFIVCKYNVAIVSDAFQTILCTCIRITLCVTWQSFWNVSSLSKEAAVVYLRHTDALASLISCPPTPAVTKALVQKQVSCLSRHHRCALDTKTVGHTHFRHTLWKQCIFRSPKREFQLYCDQLNPSENDTFLQNDGICVTTEQQVLPLPWQTVHLVFYWLHEISQKM